MLVLLPLLAWVLTVAVVRRLWLDTSRPDDLVRALLVASVASGAYLVAVTEALGLFGALRPVPLALAWALPAAGLAAVRHRRRTPAERVVWPRLDALQIAVLAAVVVIVAVTGAVAVVSAPNTWDSMTYHLPRVMHWAQNGSLAHYATPEPRQLYMSPGAEMAALHLQVLAGSDRFANLIQWLAMIGSLLAAGLLAGRFGAARSLSFARLRRDVDGRLLAMLAAATVPMGLLQAVSTQTDHVVAFFLLAAVVFLDSACRPGDRTALLAAAGATGLAALVKATAYLFLAPFLAVFAWRLAARRGRRAWRPLLVFGAVVLALNLGHYGRNQRLFGSPLKPPALGEYHQYSNEAFGVAVAASNALRSAALHLALPAPEVVATGYRAVRNAHRFLGIDPDDPRTTWPGMRFEPPPVRIHEDFSGSFWHWVGILAAVAALGASARLRRRLPRLALHAALASASFLLFASYLKWAPWHARLHLPLLLLWAPVLGTLLGRLPRLLTAGVAALLVAQAVPFVDSNPLHPVRGAASVFGVPRVEQTFVSRPRLGAFYPEAARRIAAAGCGRVGTSMPPDSWEYPLWVVLERTSRRSVRLESLTAGNVSERLLDATFEPCAVVCLRCPRELRAGYAARFGEPALAVASDHAYADDDLLFLE